MLAFCVILVSFYFPVQFFIFHFVCRQALFHRRGPFQEGDWILFLWQLLPICLLSTPVYCLWFRSSCCRGLGRLYEFFLHRFERCQCRWLPSQLPSPWSVAALSDWHTQQFPAHHYCLLPLCFAAIIGTQYVKIKTPQRLVIFWPFHHVP